MDHDTRFYKFVEFIEANRRGALIGILFLCLLGVLWTAFEKRDTIFDVIIERTEQEVVSDEQFRLMVKLNSLIETRLDSLRDNTGAVRVVVRRFHNGRQDLTTVPFEKVSDVYTSHDENFDLLVDTDRTLPMSSITYSLSRMWGTNASEPVCFGQATEQFPKGDLQRYLRQHNIKYVQVCPVTNIARYPLGLIAGVYWYVPDEAEAANIQSRTKKAADSIGGYLDMMADVKTQK